MTANYSTNLGFIYSTVGTDGSGVWGAYQNTNISTLYEQAIVGWTVIALAATSTDRTLTSTNGAADEARSIVLKFTGNLTAIPAVTSKKIVLPSGKKKTYTIWNATTNGPANLTIGTASGVTASAPQGFITQFICDGTDTYIVQDPTAFMKADGSTTMTGDLHISWPGGFGASYLGRVYFGGSTTAYVGGTAANAVGFTSGSYTATLASAGTLTTNATLASSVGLIGSYSSGAYPVVYVYSAVDVGVYGGVGLIWDTVAHRAVLAQTTSAGGGFTSGSEWMNFAAAGVHVKVPLFVDDGAYIRGGTGGAGEFVLAGVAGYREINFDDNSRLYTDVANQATFLTFTSGGTFIFNDYNYGGTGSGAFSIPAAAYKPGGGSWSSTSDGRLKTDVVEYTAGLSEVCGLSPVKYRFRPEAGHIGNDVHVGLIAQEAERHMPELVKTGPNKSNVWIDGVEIPGVKTLDPSAITFALINAVKELSHKIAAMEEKIAQLSGR